MTNFYADTDKIITGDTAPIAKDKINKIYNNAQTKFNTIDASIANIEAGIGTTAPVKSVNGQTGFVTLKTDNIAETPSGTNKYFTDARAITAINTVKGTANGIAELGADGKVPTAQLPTLASSGGDVTGPSSSQNEELAVFNGLTGKILKGAGILLSAIRTAINLAHGHTNKTALDNYNAVNFEAAGSIATHEATYDHTEIGNASKIVDIPIDLTGNAVNKVLGYDGTKFMPLDPTQVPAGSGDMTKEVYDPLSTGRVLLAEGINDGSGNTATAAEIDNAVTKAHDKLHKTSHATGGDDALTPADIGASATDHTHTLANISDFSTLQLEDLPDVPAYAGNAGKALMVANDESGIVYSSTSFGAHAEEHASTGSDPITPASIGAISANEKGVANGVAPLDSQGFLASAVIPPRLEVQVLPANNEAEMLALNVQPGDSCYRLDQSYELAEYGTTAYCYYVLRADPASNLNNWQLTGGPGGMPSVISVNGQVGAVQINSVDSATNADTLDGYHAIDFSLATHTHPRNIVLSAIGGTPTANTSSITLNTDKIGVNYADSAAGTCSYYVAVPGDYAGNGFTAKFVTRNATTVTGNVVWGVRMYPIANGTSTTLTSYVEQTVVNTISANTFGISSATATISPSTSAGNYLLIDVYRDGANASDTMAGPIELMSVVLSYAG